MYVDLKKIVFKYYSSGYKMWTRPSTECMLILKRFVLIIIQAAIKCGLGLHRMYIDLKKICFNYYSSGYEMWTRPSSECMLILKKIVLIIIQAALKCGHILPVYMKTRLYLKREVHSERLN